jgi:hypothetical protein
VACGKAQPFRTSGGITAKARPRQSNVSTTCVSRWHEYWEHALAGDRFNRSFHGLRINCDLVPAVKLLGYWKSSAGADSVGSLSSLESFTRRAKGFIKFDAFPASKFFKPPLSLSKPQFMCRFQLHRRALRPDVEQAARDL